MTHSEAFDNLVSDLLKTDDITNEGVRNALLMSIAGSLAAIADNIEHSENVKKIQSLF